MIFSLAQMSCRLNVENIATFANRVGGWMRQEGSDKCFEVARCLTHLSKAVDRHVHASGAQVTDSGRAKTERWQRGASPTRLEGCRGRDRLGFGLEYAWRLRARAVEVDDQAGSRFANSSLFLVSAAVWRAQFCRRVRSGVNVHSKASIRECAGGGAQRSRISGARPTVQRVVPNCS